MWCKAWKWRSAPISSTMAASCSKAPRPILTKTRRCGALISDCDTRHVDTWKMPMPDPESLQSRLARKPIVVAPGVYDAFTALVAQQAGFATLYVSGAAIAYTRLGRPDIGLVSMTEVAETVALIRDRVTAHLIVDADTGYGNALNVVRTIQELERAGASAIQIEDQDFPKRCGHLDGKAVIAAAEMCGKIRAAVDARRERCTLIIARTDAI